MEEIVVHVLHTSNIKENQKIDINNKGSLCRMHQQLQNPVVNENTLS
jgi:hypothetical protein